jgi:tripartite-type tricarboxylate transporter receptor subunit TctC
MKFRVSRRAALIGGSILAALPLASINASAPAMAQDFPNRPLKVVIGFPAGSGADILGRNITNKLQEISGQPVVVENRPGANSNIAIGVVKNAKPDGYTMLFVANSNMAMNKWLFKSLPFDTQKDFTPVAAWAQLGFVVVVGADSKHKTLADLTEFLKSKPQNKYGTTNQTAVVSSEYFRQLAGFEAVNVGYRTAPDATPDVVNGTLDFMIMDGTFALGQIRNGKIKALAVTSQWRIADIPDVPTMDEAGHKGFDFAPWWATYVPVGTPAPIVAKLEGYHKQIAEMPDIKAALQKIASVPLTLGSTETAAKLAGEIDKWGPIIKAAGIVPQE